MRPDKNLRQSKKAIVLGIALLNLNAIFIATVFVKDIPIEVVTQMITAVLFLVGIYTGVQGGIDMVQSNKMTAIKTDNTTTNIEKKYEIRMEYADK